MSDENINPQNIPMEALDPNSISPKSPFLNSKKLVLLLLFLLITFGLLSFWFLNQGKQTPPNPIPTVTPITTQVPIPTGTNELILILKLKETITLPDASISVTYSSADVPGENCFDCVASDVLEVKIDNQQKILDYACGGITGECITKQEAYGYEIEIIDRPAKDMLKLKIIEK